MTQQEETEIPKGWERTLVGSFLKLKNGYAFKSADYVEAGEDTVPVIRISDVKVDGANSDKANHVPACKAVEGFEIEKGDQLIAMSGATTGKVGVYQGTTPAYQNQRVGNLKLISDENFNKQFKNYLIKAKSQAILDVAYGGAQPNVSARGVEEIEVLIPPLPEQKRIVEKLDCLLAQVDTIQQRLNNLPDIIKRFRQSVLAAAVSGKLTEQWRGENPVTSLKPNDYFDKKLGDVENKEYYGEPPPSWCWVRFGSIVKLINGDRGKNYPNKSEYVEVGVPFINTGHIDPNGSLSISRMNFITKDKFKSLGSGKIQTNDLVYCLRGATMGKTAIVNNFEKGAIASSLVIVRPSDSVNYKFAYYFLISPQAKDLITKFDNGSAQPNLSAKSLAMYPLCLPSLKEQTEIVRLVEQYFALADTLEKNLANAKQRVDNLTQSILAKAFRGELVPQDPNDEPADKLLARIKAARLEAEKLEKAAKKAAKASKK